jgi:hypothetical protein
MAEPVAEQAPPPSLVGMQETSSPRPDLGQMTLSCASCGVAYPLQDLAWRCGNCAGVLDLTGFSAAARRLASHPAVTRVRYPGLPADPHHQRARAQMRGFGAIVSFEVADARSAGLLTGALELIVSGTSLGGVETTIDRRNRWPGEEHIPPGLLRLSVGLEHPDDLWADLQDALGRVSPGQQGHARPRRSDQAQTGGR